MVVTVVAVELQKRKCNGGDCVCGVGGVLV